MFAISQATEVGIIAALGVINLFLAVMMLTINKKKEKSTKEVSKSDTGEKKHQKKSYNRKAKKKEEPVIQENENLKDNQELYNERKVKEFATLSILMRGECSDDISGTIQIDDSLAERGEYKLGSKKTSEYIIRNQFISGTHAIISKREGRYYIMDVSRNGTQISAIPYRSQEKNLMMYKMEVGKEEELLDGTVISLAGKAEILFRINRK